MRYSFPNIKQSLPLLPFLLLPPLFWAGNFAVGRAVRADIPPYTLSFGRWVIALVVLLPFVFTTMKRDWQQYRQHWGKIITVSIFGVAAFNTLVYKGLHSTTTTNAILLNSCIPVLIMLIGVLFYRQKIKITQAIGLAVSLLGVLVIVLQGQWANVIALSFNVGDIIVFSAMICWAIYTLLMKDIPASIDRKGLMAIQIIIALISLFPLLLWEQWQGSQVISWNNSTLLGLAYVGIFPSVIAYILYSVAIQKVGPVISGLSIHLMPVFGVLLSVSLLGEHFHFYHLCGIGLIATGLVLSQK
ncbi:DMT family transporter [Lonepinella sp. BR2271]|uniref:DMT family transporter n=1 Tax=Lonepinella sp. BR2271 TaxID=3434550 RepID=UPI003F6E0053